MTQKILSTKVRRQRDKMIKQIEQMEINYRTAAINYFKKRIDMALFNLNTKRLIEDSFYVYPPLIIEDVLDLLKEKVNTDYLSNVQIVNSGVIQVNIKRKET